MSGKINQFLKICRNFNPTRITIKTEDHHQLKDIIMLMGSELNIEVTRYEHEQDFTIMVSDGEQMEIKLTSLGISRFIENAYSKDSDQKEIEASFIMPKGVFTLSLYGRYRQDNRGKKTKFNDLVTRAAACTTCPKMTEKKAVISRLNGNIEADLMFIAEAPGPSGAEITRVPMSGDSSGENFEELLNHIGLTRDEVYITHAVLCCPTDKYEKVRVPSTKEIANCSHYLLEQIELVQPKLIVTLGSNALKALHTIKKHSIVLKDHVAQPQQWNSYKVFPLYHTSTVVMNRRKRTKQQQMQDFIKLKSTYIGTGGQVQCPTTEPCLKKP